MPRVINAGITRDPDMTSGKVVACFETAPNISRDATEIVACARLWQVRMFRLFGFVSLLGISACDFNSVQSQAAPFCDYQAQFVDRLTGERIHVQLAPLTESRSGWDRAYGLEWCDFDVLCDAEIEGRNPERSVGEPLNSQLPTTQRRVIVDPDNRSVLGLANFRIYEPEGPGWDLLAPVTIQDEWDGTAEQWSYIEASMFPVGSDRYIDHGAFYDAEGCMLRVPDEVQLPTSENLLE